VTFRQVWGQSFSAIVSPINRSTGFLSTNMPNSSINVLYSHDAYLHVAPSVVLRKFPSIEGSMNSRQIFQNFPAYFRFDSSFSGISRRDANISTPAFVERFDFHPSIQTPIWRGNAFELSQEFGFRETAYSHSLQPAVEQSALMRSTFDYTASFSGPELTKSYGTWRHTIQPTVEYRYVTGADRFRETIIVDDIDLVANTSEVEYGITNRIMGDRELLRWRIAQVAYFDPTFGGAFIDGQRNVFEPLLSVTGASFADSPRHHSPIVSTFRLTPNKANAVEVQVDYDTQLHAARSAVIGNTLARGKWSSSILYAFTKATLLQASNNQLHGMVSYGNLYGRGFAVTTNVGYDVQSRQFQGATTQLGYNSECWGVSVEFSEFNLGARQEHKLRFAFNLKNIGSLGTLQRPDRVF
jgi:LPS-assembly protein